MTDSPLVSVIIIFLDAADFLQEAVESVLAQTYEHWELLLVDDGSTDKSTQIARHYENQYTGKIIYLEHSDHDNLGKGVSRNLGIRQARGEYIAFLDADDIWLSNKLDEQTAILKSYPEAGMIYGDTLYWYSWTGNPEDISKDFIPALGVKTGTLIYPPTLLQLYLRGKAAVPCTCSIIVRRNVAIDVGGFDETCSAINNFYEDQAFYAKICLKTPVVAMRTCWDKYRQRSESSEDIEKITRNENLARQSFLIWLNEYMTQHGIDDINIRIAIRKELWLQQKPTWHPNSEIIQARLRWAKKWILRFEELILPVAIQARLWLKG